MVGGRPERDGTGPRGRRAPAPGMGGTGSRVMVDVDRRGVSAAPSGRAGAGRRRRFLHPTGHVRSRDDVRRAHRPGDRGGGSSGDGGGGRPRQGLPRAHRGGTRCRHGRGQGRVDTPQRTGSIERRSTMDPGSERPDGVPADRSRDHRRLRGVTDRLDRPRRGRPRRGGAPPGDRRIDDDRRHRPPRGIGRSRHEGGDPRRRGRGRSSVRGARRRRHDGPAHGVLGIGRRRVGAGRACARARSRGSSCPAGRSAAT